MPSDSHHHILFIAYPVFVIYQDIKYTFVNNHALSPFNIREQITLFLEKRNHLFYCELYFSINWSKKFLHRFSAIEKQMSDSITFHRHQLINCSWLTVCHSSLVKHQGDKFWRYINVLKWIWKKKIQW